MDIQSIENFGSVNQYFEHVNACIERRIDISEIVASYLTNNDDFKPRAQEQIYEFLTLPLYTNKTVIYLDLDGVLIKLQSECNELDPVALSNFHELIHALGNVLIVLSSQQRLGFTIFEIRDWFVGTEMRNLLIGKTPDELPDAVEDQITRHHFPGLMLNPDYPKVRAHLKETFHVEQSQTGLRNYFHREVKILHHAEFHGSKFFALDDLILYRLQARRQYIFIRGADLLTRENVLDSIRFHGSPQVAVAYRDTHNIK